MTNVERITKWLKENKNLLWTRTSGDEPPVKEDRIYINRSEGYEIRDFIIKYYKVCNLKHSESNYEKSYDKIINYRKGEKVKSDDLLNYLKEKLEK